MRGQYRAGAVGGKPVPGYIEEPGIAPDSRTETFVAIKAEIANWRWEGVPFYLRTGKRMQSRVAEIVVHFRDVPHAIFPKPLTLSPQNRLVIQLQPEESIKLYFLVKQPGDTLELTPHLARPGLRQLVQGAPRRRLRTPAAGRDPRPAGPVRAP